MGKQKIYKAENIISGEEIYGTATELAARIGRSLEYIRSCAYRNVKINGEWYITVPGVNKNRLDVDYEKSKVLKEWDDFMSRVNRKKG